MARRPEIRLLSPDGAEGDRVPEDRLWWQQGEEAHRHVGYRHCHDTCGRREAKRLFTNRRLTRLRVEMSPRTISPID